MRIWCYLVLRVAFSTTIFPEDSQTHTKLRKLDSHAHFIDKAAVGPERIRRDLWDNLHFNSSEGRQTEKYSLFKRIFNEKHFFKCPRRISRIGAPFNLTILMSATGYSILEPTYVSLASLSTVTRQFATKIITNETNGKTTKTLDLGCKNRDKILNTILMYKSEDIMMKVLGSYQIQQLPSAVMAGIYEIISMKVMCNFTSHELDETLAEYINIATGSNINSCSTVFCTLPPEEAKQKTIQFTQIALGINILVFLWYAGFRKCINTANKRSCYQVLTESFQIFAPPTAQRLVIRMNRTDQQHNNCQTGGERSISVNSSISDSESDIYPANYDTRKRKNQASRDKKRVLSAFFTFFLTFFLIGCTFNKPADLQNFLCEMLDKTRSTIL